MSNIAIKIENLSKLYRLGEVGTGTISHDLNRWWARIRGKEDPYTLVGQVNDRSKKSESDYVWSLKDINFEVKEGEVLGIIGRNGAGKSTLLKLISQITSPTTGNIKIKGRIASLLEVGTGMNPELTAKENIYLNGAILGMTKKEIDAKFEEIVEFSGCAMYVDTPIKRFSSGMKVRLGFAVAAFLETEILIVDEVLAVGDAEFQKKSIGKMQNVASQGRTVLFVSHDLAAVKSLCTRGVVLDQGKVVFEGGIEEAVIEYQKQRISSSSYNCEDMEEALGNENIKVLSFNVTPINGGVISISSGVNVQMEFFNFKKNINLDSTFELRTLEEQAVFHRGTLISENNDSKTGKYTVSFSLPPNLLNAGNYYFKIIFGENQRYPLYINGQIVSFEVQNETDGSNSQILPGVIKPRLDFNVSFHE